MKSAVWYAVTLAGRTPAPVEPWMGPTFVILATIGIALAVLLVFTLFSSVGRRP